MDGLPMDLVALVLRAAYDDMNIDTRRALRIRPRRFGPSGPCMLSALWARRSESWSRYEKLRRLNNGTSAALESVSSGFTADGSRVQDLSLDCALRFELSVYALNGGISDVVMRIEKIKNEVAFTFTQCNVNTGAVVHESIFDEEGFGEGVEYGSGLDTTVYIK